MIMSRGSLAFAVRLLNDLLLVLNTIVLLTLPWLLAITYDSLSQIYYMVESYRFWLLFLYPCGLFTLLILILGHRILRNLEGRKPFARRNFRDLKRLGFVFLLLCLAFVVKIFFYSSILTIFCAGIFLVLTLLAWLLSETFRQACEIWEEHQLTI